MTQRYLPMHRTDEDVVTESIIVFAREYGATATEGSRCVVQSRLAGGQKVVRAAACPARVLHSPLAGRSSETGYPV